MKTDQDAGERGDTRLAEKEALELAAQRRGRFLVFCCLLVAAVLGANLLYGTVLITRSNRSYCLGCHRAAGPALMWEASDRHAQGIACGQCHGMLPGRKGRCGAFSAHAETVNPNCIGCHRNVLKDGPLDKVVEVRLRADPDSGAASKAYHWKLGQLMYGWHLKKGICLCTDCHRNISHERESQRFAHRPKMSYCKACHYHAAKDDYVQVSPLPMLEVKESTAGGGNQGPGDRPPRPKGQRGRAGS